MEINTGEDDDRITRRGVIGSILGGVGAVVLLFGAMTAAADESAFPLLVDRNTEIGSLSLSQGEYSYEFEITYDTTGSRWAMTESHLHVCDDIEAVPKTESGDPDPDKFDHSEIYTIPRGNSNIYGDTPATGRLGRRCRPCDRATRRE